MNDALNRLAGLADRQARIVEGRSVGARADRATKTRPSSSAGSAEDPGRLELRFAGRSAGRSWARLVAGDSADVQGVAGLSWKHSAFQFEVPPPWT